MPGTSLQHIGLNRVNYLGRDLLYFAGGDYHGFSRDPEMLRIAGQAAEYHGLNISASRGSTGNDILFAEFEAAMAEFFSVPAACLCSSGFVANLALIEALETKIDELVVDRGCHPSTHHAVRWLGKTRRFFSRNNIAELESALAESSGQVLVICDSIGGMRGDQAPVEEILARALAGGAILVIDDSHGFGVLGAGGRGCLETFTLDRELVAQGRLVITGSLNKAFAGQGGLILGSASLREKVYATSAFLTASPVAPAAMNVAMAACRRLKVPPSLCERMRARAGQFKQWLRHLDLEVEQNDHPVIAVYPRNQVETQHWHRVFLDAGIYPSLVPRPDTAGENMLKLTLCSSHSDTEIEQLYRAIAVATRGSE